MLFKEYIWFISASFKNRSSLKNYIIHLIPTLLTYRRLHKTSRSGHRDSTYEDI